MPPGLLTPRAIVTPERRHSHRTAACRVITACQAIYDTPIGGSRLSWFDREPDEQKRRQVGNWLMTLLETPELAGGIPIPDDPSEVAFVPGTNIVVTYMVVPELNRIFIDEIEDLDLRT